MCVHMCAVHVREHTRVQACINKYPNHYGRSHCSRSCCSRSRCSLNVYMCAVHAVCACGAGTRYMRAVLACGVCAVHACGACVRCIRTCLCAVRARVRVMYWNHCRRSHSSWSRYGLNAWVFRLQRLRLQRLRLQRLRLQRLRLQRFRYVHVCTCACAHVPHTLHTGTCTCTACTHRTHGNTARTYRTHMCTHMRSGYSGSGTLHAHAHALHTGTCARTTCTHRTHTRTYRTHTLLANMRARMCARMCSGYSGSGYSGSGIHTCMNAHVRVCVHVPRMCARFQATVAQAPAVPVFMHACTGMHVGTHALLESIHPCEEIISSVDAMCELDSDGQILCGCSSLRLPIMGD